MRKFKVALLTFKTFSFHVFAASVTIADKLFVFAKVIKAKFEVWGLISEA